MVLCWRTTTPEVVTRRSYWCMARRVIGRFWSQQVPRFSCAHRVVAVDLRGHGESDAPSERYTVRLFVEDLALTCTQLRVESPVVIGHSLGGLVALDFASAYPDRVAGAVLIDSPLLPGGKAGGGPLVSTAGRMAPLCTPAVIADAS